MRKITRSLAALALAASSLTVHAETDVETINWGGTTGLRNWHETANWTGGVIPNDSLKRANLSVNLGSNLTLDLGATDTTVAGLDIGGTSAAVTTAINGTGRLIFRNDDTFVLSTTANADFDNSTTVNGRDFLIWQRNFGATSQVNNGNGDANADGTVNQLDLAIWQEQYGLGTGLFNIGTPNVASNGIVGSVNTINAPIHILNEQVEFGGSTNLTLNGNITYEGDIDNAGVSSASFRAINAGFTLTVNGNITVANSDTTDGIDFRINNNVRAQGTVVINGVIQGAGDLQLGAFDNGSLLPLSTIRLNNANTYTGSIRAGRGNLILAHNDALGKKSEILNDNGTPGDPGDDYYPQANYRQNGPVNFGYNMISTADDRVISNEITMAQWQTVKGDHSLELSGHITQTNNRGIINMLPAGKTLKISGDLDIWEDDEILERRFVVDGTGKTLITGTISDNDEGSTGQDRRIQKTGTGVLVIDVAPGANNHSGFEIVTMGNLHYANNGSLNVNTTSNATYSAKILSTGGAVGVDVHPAGQNITTNTTFIGKIDPTSTGGLMLASTDAGVNINLSAAALNNVENMSIAAPENGLTYTGTLTPNNFGGSIGQQYRLGGGSGTLTLPNAQLSGSRSLSVRNGGTVRLLGNNSYTGATVIESKYTQSNQERAAADSASEAPEIFIDRLVAPTLEVNTLANGGVNSSIGSSSNAASNLYIHGSTLKYVGTGHSTDRLFSIGTAGATLNASGTGAVNFTNTGLAATPDAIDPRGTLDDFTLSPNVIANVSNSRDVIIGMTITDPEASDPNTDFAIDKCAPDGSNCIPAFDTQTPPKPTVVTGVSNDGKQIGISSEYGFIYKENTLLVLGAVPRTLTLSGTNTQANVLSPVITNSAKGGVVNITKNGTGTWLLESVNTTTGVTTVDAGTLGGNGGVGGNLIVNAGGTFAPGGLNTVGDFSVAGSFTLNSSGILGIQLAGTSPAQIDLLNVTGAATLSGALNVSLLSFSPALNSTYTVLTAAGGITDNGLTLTGAAGFQKQIVGNSLVLKYVGGALSALASVPEPGSMVLIGLAMVCLGSRRQAGA